MVFGSRGRRSRGEGLVAIVAMDSDGCVLGRFLSPVTGCIEVCSWGSINVQG